MKKLFIIFILSVCALQSFAEEAYFVKTLPLDPSNTASLQRGAKIYFNYCSGCHSLAYERYARVAQLIGAEDAQKQIYTALVQKYMLFDPQATLQQPILSGMNPADAKKWFGVEPPDLTNITLVYSPAWVYNFLRGFYRDDSRDTGANNLFIPNSLMPNVLLPLRGETEAIWTNKQFDHFVTLHAGQLKPLAFDQAMFDLVNFLGVVAEPNRSTHQLLGVLVIAFLSILLLIIYFWYRLTQNNKDA